MRKEKRKRKKETRRGEKGGKEKERRREGRETRRVIKKEKWRMRVCDTILAIDFVTPSALRYMNKC